MVRPGSRVLDLFKPALSALFLSLSVNELLVCEYVCICVCVDADTGDTENAWE